MRALTYHGPKRLRVDDKPTPRLEHPRDAIIRVTATAICGSDLHLYHGLVPDTRVGSTFGHEFAGTVEEVGRDVRNLKPGDRVVVPFNVACGECFYCARELYASCERSNPWSDLLGGAFGYSHTAGGYEGGQAEYVRVPFADVGPMLIPDDMDDEQVLFLSDILPTGYQAAEMGDLRGGETVVVFGCGPVGLLAQKCAWLLGAGRVIGIDRIPERLELAQRFAGSETIDFSREEDLVALIHEQTDGRGADVCIDAVGLEATGRRLQTVLGRLKLEAGSATALEWAIAAARRHANLSIVGVYGPPFNMIPIGAAMQKGLTLRMGQCNVRKYMPLLLEHIRAGRIDPKAIITHRLPLEDAPHAYELFARKEDGCVKCVLTPQAA